MVTFSRWDPSSGVYDYFEAADLRPGLNDDLPTPSLPAGTDIGVPSTDCGRPMPRGAEPVGSGEFAVGMITLPAGVTPLSGEGAPSERQLTYLIVGALGAGLMYVVLRGWRG